MPPIKGAELIIFTVAVSLGIFMNILDTSIANVAIPTIAGYMAVSANQGTWVITSFSVSMAIMLPLTGWLAKRFGEVKLFVVSTALFTIASVLCGLSTSLPMLVFFRVLQGAVAGPMVPLSQSLLLANFPPNKKGLATGLWAMVALTAPVLGPILGGTITDNISWPWIFYINAPIGIFSVYFTWKILHKRETEIVKPPIDYVGIILLAIGVGCLQILLDQGKDLDWFNSEYITILAIAAITALSFFVVWELTEKHPIVDLTLFKNRNFTVGTLAMSFGFMAYFGSVVILPLWLQTQMNYTATWAGLATAPMGILPVLLAPIIGKSMHKVDLRILVSIGFFVFAYCSFWIAEFNTNVTFNEVAFVRLVTGLGAPFFFIPTIAISLSGFPDNRLASAAGLANFFRILAGSFGTSISVTLWARRESIHQSTLVQYVTSFHSNMQDVLTKLHGAGHATNVSYGEIASVLIKQAYMLSTNDVFYISGITFLCLMVLVWFARPPFTADSSIVAE